MCGIYLHQSICLQFWVHEFVAWSDVPVHTLASSSSMPVCHETTSAHRQPVPPTWRIGSIGPSRLHWRIS